MTGNPTNLGSKPLRPGVVAVLFNLSTLNVFLGRIYNPSHIVPHKWSTVEGGIDVTAHERPYQAARREFQEEISLTDLIFIGALTEPMIYGFNGHPRYSGKSLAALFYGFAPAPRRCLDLDPWDTHEDMAFEHCSFVDPIAAKEFLKTGATPERQRFCEQLADRINEVHIALQFAQLSHALISARQSGAKAMVEHTQKFLLNYGDGYTIREQETPMPPTHLPAPTAPRQPSFLAISAAMLNQTLALKAT